MQKRANDRTKQGGWKAGLAAPCLALLALLMLLPGTANAWPVEADWIALTNAAGYITDPLADTTGSYLDIVGDSTYPAVYVYNDGTYIYYRMRLDGDPTSGGIPACSGGNDCKLRPFGWGILIDTDMDGSGFEWIVSMDGTGTKRIVIAQNTSQGTLGDPSDSAEIEVYTNAIDKFNLDPDWEVAIANSTWSGDADYYLEWRYPYDIWLYTMGLSPTSVIRYFVGSGANGSVLSKDLMGTSLYTDLTNPYMPTGTQPATGSVLFRDITNTADVTEIYPTNTIYIQLTDLDLNTQRSQIQTATVVVNTPSGDSVTVTLTETGADTGVFWGSVSTEQGSPNTSDSILQVNPVEIVTVDYLDEVDANLYEDQHRYDYLTVLQSADVGLAKTVSTSTPNVGDLITFTLTAINNGPSQVTSLLVEDWLPSGVQNETSSGYGTYNYATGMWTVGIVNSGQNVSIAINVRVRPGTEYQSYTNTATIKSAAQYDNNGINNTASASFTVQGADLRVTKTVNNPYPNVGDYVTFTVLVESLGSNDASGIELYDMLPAGLTFNSATADAGSTYSNATGYWNSPSGGFYLAVGATNTLTITAQVDAGTSGLTLTNLANIVHADQADPSALNNSSSASVAVGGTDLRITKVANTSSPNVSNTVIYTVQVVNIGPNSATGVQVRDWLPSGVTHISNSPTSGTFYPASGYWNGIATLQSGGVNNSATLTITTRVNNGTGGQTLTNIANIVALNEADLDASNDSATYPVTVQAADIQVRKFVNTTAPSPGQLVSYFVNATNLGPNTATALLINDIVPSGASGLSNIAAYPAVGTFSSNQWNIGTLNMGSTVQLIINGNAPTTSGTTVNNTAYLYSANQEDTNSTNNSSTATFTVGGTDFAVSKISNTVTPQEGQLVTFTITVTNNGPSAGTNVVLYDALPTDLTYIAHWTTQGTYNPSTAGSDDYQWTVGNLAVGATRTLIINTTVNAGTNGTTIRNTARLYSSTQPDIYQPNNIESVDLLVGSTDLRITKTISNSTPNEGQEIYYTVTVENMGVINATNVDVRDFLPSYVTFTNSNEGSNFNSSTGIWNVTTLARQYVMPGLSNAISLIINATVSTGTPATPITNEARIINATQHDPDTSNNIASVSFTVPRADLSIQKTADNATPVEGTPVKFTVTLTNNGPSNASGIVVTDKLPFGLAYIDDDSGGLYDSASGDWSVGLLNSGASKSLIINATAGAGGVTRTNTAFINTAAQLDPDSTDNSASISITPTIIPKPSFTVTKAVSAYYDPINTTANPVSIPGSHMLYIVTVSNSGPGDADEFTISDAIPSYAFTFVNGAVPTSLIFNYGGLGDSTDSVAFDNGSGLYTYTPAADPLTGADPNVTAFIVNFSGTFGPQVGANTPSCELRFKVVVQ